MFFLTGSRLARSKAHFPVASRPHEGTPELAIHLWRSRIDIYVLAGKKLASIFYAINSGWLNLNRLETSGVLARWPVFQSSLRWRCWRMRGWSTVWWRPLGRRPPVPWSPCLETDLDPIASLGA